MSNFTNQLKEHFASQVTTLATCWKITLKDGQVFGFTDCDENILFDKVTYKPNSVATPSAISSNLGLAIDNFEIGCVLDDKQIKEKDIIVGKYDNAEIIIFMVNYNDLTQGNFILKRGWLGEIKLHNGNFISEIRSISQKTCQTIGNLYSSNCRASFGDKKCNINKAKYTKQGKVTTVIASNTIVDENLNEENSYFDYGIIHFISGKNKGLNMEIKQFINKKIIFTLNMPFTIEIGDQFLITAGCDKTLSSCNKKFNNVLNFRGEPFVPGYDKLVEIE